MRNSSYARQLYFISLYPQQQHDFIQQLSQAAATEIYPMSPEGLMEAHPKHRNRILVFDYLEHGDLLKKIKNLPLLWKNFETIAVNVPKRLPTDELITFGHLKGLFYQKDSITKVAEGLNAIVNGANWLPRDVTSQLLFYYRNMINSQNSPATVDLTIREIQVLRCLQNGATNMQMAEELHISEYTVKSHLYQIFKKLSVKNRVQAIAWADQNLIS